MYIQKEKKLVFVANPKTGSRSIHDLLLKYDRKTWTLEGEERNWIKINYHMSITGINKQYPETLNYKSFAFVRNPFDRLVSTYFEFKKFPERHPKFGDKFSRDFKTFNDFVLNLKNSNYSDYIHFKPQIYFLGNKKGPTVDFIGRYENFENDLKKIFTKFYLEKINEIPLPKIGPSGIKADDRSFYSKELIDIVLEHYNEDFENFNYSI